MSFNPITRAVTLQMRGSRRALFSRRQPFSTKTVRGSKDSLEHLPLGPDSGSPQRKETAFPAPRCQPRRAPLRAAMETLLIYLRLIAAEDTQELTGLLLQLAPRSKRTHTRTAPSTVSVLPFPGSAGCRCVGANHEPLQGADPVNPPERRGSIYPGDREIHDQIQ